MPDNSVNQDQCESRRLHCGEAMARGMRAIEKRQSDFLDGLDKRMAPLCDTVSRHDERIKAHGRVLGVLITLLVLTVGGAVICRVLGL